jgi:pyruvate dehydrogenase E1 component alpha subunit
MRSKKIKYNFLPHQTEKVVQELGKEKLVEVLNWMLKIRNFEVRAESAYQQGLIGGFFHAYIGQEAIQTACLYAFGEDNWWVTTYRCHALALLLGATPTEIMSELYGRSTGNAKGRGGSMHLYTDKLLGGFGIVGGQVPIATGAAFTLKYLNQKNKVAVCYLGDGAVPQGAFYEALNMAALWDLPCIYVIENNQWGMGTHFQRANSVDYLAEDKAPGFGIKGYTLNGMDFFNCYAGFKEIHARILEDSRPVLVEVVTERFRGHSISDPGLYRSKDELKEKMALDPILFLKQTLIDLQWIDEEQFKELDKKWRQVAMDAMKAAEESPWPSIETLEKDVFAP